MLREQEVVQPGKPKRSGRVAHAEADAGSGHTGMRLDIIVSATRTADLSKGQHALALVYPEPEKGGRGKLCT